MTCDLQQNLTVFCEWSQNLEDHLFLLVLRLLLEETHQLLRDVGGGKLLFAGLWKEQRGLGSEPAHEGSGLWVPVLT